MNKMTITREIDAVQWLGPEHPLPEGCFDVMPEVEWAAGRDFVYFTYGNLAARDWMGVEKLAEKPAGGSFEGAVQFTPKEGAPYWRQVLPFAFWSVKSESTIKARQGDANAHRAVFLNVDDEAEVALFRNYASLESWPNPLPRFAEYREINGSYGRGYRPHYLAPGDWLVREQGKPPYVLSDEEMQKLRAGIGG
jgi:hypothetical protein